MRAVHSSLSIVDIFEELVAALDKYAPYWSEDFAPTEVWGWLELRWSDLRGNALPADDLAQLCLSELEDAEEEP